MIFTQLNLLLSLIRYVITELMQSDLHKIIVSPQHLSTDHIKVFLYQILRGNDLHTKQSSVSSSEKSGCFSVCRIKIFTLGEDSAPGH